MANYNTKEFKHFVSKKLENGPNTSIDWIVYSPIVGKNNDISKYKIEILTVLYNEKYLLDLPNDKEIQVKGIENKIIDMFKPYEHLITSIKYGLHRKTLKDIVVSNKEYYKIMKQKEEEYKRRKKATERIQELNKEKFDKEKQRISLQQFGSPVK